MALLTVAGFFFFYSVNSSIDGGDSATYLVGAKSILAGTGYSDISKPIASPIQHFPPGYSFFLASLFFFTGVNVVATKIANAVLMLLSILLSFHFFKKFFSKNVSLALSAAFGLSLAVLWYSHMVLSEPLFIVVSLVSVFFAQKYFESKNTAGFYFFGAAVFLALSFFVRSIGAVLIAAAVCFFLWNKKPQKGMALFLACIVPIILWFFYSGAALEEFDSPKDSYISQIFAVDILRPELGFAGPVEIGLRFLKTLAYYLAVSVPTAIASPLGALNFFFGENFLLYGLGLAASAVFLAGFFLSCREKKSLAHFYLAFYLLLIFLIPYNYQSVVNRILLPVLPFLLLFFGKGLLALLEKFKIQKLSGFLPEKAAILVLIAFIASSIGADLFYISSIHSRQFDSAYANMEIAAVQLKGIAGSNSLVYSDSPERLFLFSGIRSVRPSDERMVSFLKSQNVYGAEFALVTQYFEPKKAEQKFVENGFEVVFTAPDNVTKILKKSA